MDHLIVLERGLAMLERPVVGLEQWDFVPHTSPTFQPPGREGGAGD